MTVVEMERYTGYSRQTISAWLNRGKLKGRRVGGDGTPWLIPANEVEKIRLARVEALQAQIEKINTPVMGGVVVDV